MSYNYSGSEIEQALSHWSNLRQGWEDKKYNLVSETYHQPIKNNCQRLIDLAMDIKSQIKRIESEIERI